MSEQSKLVLLLSDPNVFSSQLPPSILILSLKIKNCRETTKSLVDPELRV